MEKWELEKCMTFATNNILFFINSMQFMNFSLGGLVKNLSNNGFEYLSHKFSGDLLE